MDYTEMMERLVREGNWDGVSATFVRLGANPTPEELIRSVDAYIKSGIAAGYSHETLQAKLSEAAINVLKAVMRYMANLMLVRSLTESLTGAAGHRATKELCQECDDLECESRVALYAPSTMTVH